MANEDKKDFNAMLHDNKDMPKFQIITDEKSIEKYGGNRMYFAPPIAYDEVMKKIPYAWEEWGQLRSKRYICPYFFWVESQSWHLLFSGYYHILTGRGDGFRLMGSKEIFQRQSWVVQKSTMPKT